MKRLVLSCVLLCIPGNALALSVNWASVASDPSFLLDVPNFYNTGGIEYSWYGRPLTDPGQRDLGGFRSEMLATGRYGGGINWDSLPYETVVADNAGLPLDVLGLPSPVQIVATTTGMPLRTFWGGPISGGNHIGTHSAAGTPGYFNAGDRLTFEFMPTDGLQLHGFGMVLTDSGWSHGGATMSFYNEQTLLASFDPSDGILFHDFNTDDNFVGYWSDLPITKVDFTADSGVLMGRFDDVGLIFTPAVVPEPITGIGLLVAISGLGTYIRRRLCDVASN